MLLLVFYSCDRNKKEAIDSIVKKWMGKEILFPENSSFITYDNRDSVDFLSMKSDYRIVTYVNSETCFSCNLRLPFWKGFVMEVDSVSLDKNIPVLFYFYPKNKSDLYALLERHKFIYPVCFDEEDSLNKLNHFPTDMAFQTFLLNSDNKVLAIGNPINPKVKELYLKIIQSEKIGRKDESKVTRTKADIGRTLVPLGKFDWRKEQKAVFVLKNTGDKPLVIQDVVTSCGCISAEYFKKPVRPNDSLELCVTYKAEHPEHFDKTITVYCNTASSPIVLRIIGTAQ